MRKRSGPFSSTGLLALTMVSLVTLAGGSTSLSAKDGSQEQLDQLEQLKQAPESNIEQGESMNEVMAHHVRGPFEVKLQPQPEDDFLQGNLGRMTIDKSFSGALEGTSKGQMLSAMSEVKGSAGYVAIEKVTGTLEGRSGSFVLQHNSTMSRGVPQQMINVVPDSGTDELVGLSGRMTIEIADGKHFYVFEYSIPPAP